MLEGEIRLKRGDHERRVGEGALIGGSALLVDTVRAGRRRRGRRGAGPAHSRARRSAACSRNSRRAPSPSTATCAASARALIVRAGARAPPRFRERLSDEPSPATGARRACRTSRRSRERAFAALPEGFRACCERPRHPRRRFPRRGDAERDGRGDRVRPARPVPRPGPRAVRRQRRRPAPCPTWSGSIAGRCSTIGARARTRSEAVVAHVLIHEIGHHFGLSDADMEAIEAGIP